MALTATDKSDLKAIVVSAVQELVQDVKDLKQSAHEHSADIKDLKQLASEHAADIKDLKQLADKQGASIKYLKQLAHEQGALLEDLDDRFAASNELLRENLSVKDQVAEHEARLVNIESTQSILKSAVTEHSQKLNSL